MAFSLSMLDVRQVVSIFDPAIDPDASDLRGYVAAGYPAAYGDFLKFRDGLQPTLWSIRPLDYEVIGSIQRRYDRLAQKDGNLDLPMFRTESYAQAFRFGVCGWDNLGISYETEVVGGKECIKEALLKKLSLSREIKRAIMEIGKLVMGENVMDDVAKN